MQRQWSPSELQSNLWTQLSGQLGCWWSIRRWWRGILKAGFCWSRSRWRWIRRRSSCRVQVAQCCASVPSWWCRHLRRRWLRLRTFWRFWWRCYRCSCWLGLQFGRQLFSVLKGSVRTHLLELSHLWGTQYYLMMKYSLLGQLRFSSHLTRHSNFWNKNCWSQLRF